MRKNIFMIAVSVFISVTILIACDTSARKVEDARANVSIQKDNVADAKNDLNQAIQDSTNEYNEYQRFKQESEERINSYERNIAELKIKIANEKKSGKIKYQKMVDDLELKTAELKQNLKEYKEEGKDKWAAFKIKFNNNMDDLGRAISNFFTSEKKK